MRRPLHLCCLVLALNAVTRSALGQALDYAGFEGMFDEPVTNSATGKPERLSDTPLTMNIITAEDIRRSGARSLATLLRSLPGVLTYRGSNGVEAFNMAALLLNGREIYIAAFTETFLSALPVELEEIRQIEVVKGPLSALYGFNSGAGVINIITFDPANDPINDVRGRVGSGARRDGAIIATVPLTAGIGLRLTEDDDHADDRDGANPRNNKIAAQNPDRRSFSATLSAGLPNGDHSNWELSHSDISLRSMVPQATIYYDARLQTDAVKGDYVADTTIGRVSALLSLTSMTVPQAVTQTSNWFSLHDHTIDSKVNDLFKLGTNDSFRIEMEARNEDIHTSLSLAPVSTILWAGSAMWDHQLAPGLSIVNAVRFADTRTQQLGTPQTGGVLTFHSSGEADNSALIYKLAPGDTLRAAFSRGLALPSQLNFEQLGLVTGGGRKSSLSSESDLRNTQNSEIRFTWDHMIDPLATTARISVYDRKTMDAEGLQPLALLAGLLPSCLAPTPRSLPGCRLLAGQTKISGVFDGLLLELDHKSGDGLSWSGSYSLERLSPHPTAASAGFLPGLGNSQIYSKLSVRAGYRWDSWTADLRLLYTSPVHSVTLETLPSPNVAYARYDSALTLSPHLSWSPGNDLTIDLAADNLWPYQTNFLQRVPATYFMTLTWSY